MAFSLAVLAPLCLAVAWVPVRTHLPNTDLALVLVVVVAAVGMAGRHLAVALGALVAATSFEFFDTAPFQRLAIARQPDVETTLVLLVVSGIAGALAVEVTRLIAARRATSEVSAAIREVSGRLATGGEVVQVVATVADDLCRLLELESCTYEAGPPSAGRRRVTRDGTIVVPGATPAGIRGTGMVVDLSVLGQGEELGRFVLELGAALPSRERLLDAVTFADQVGAALAAHASASPVTDGGAVDEPPSGRPGLHLVN